MSDNQDQTSDQTAVDPNHATTPNTSPAPTVVIGWAEIGGSADSYRIGSVSMVTGQVSAGTPDIKIGSVQIDIGLRALPTTTSEESKS